MAEHGKIKEDFLHRFMTPRHEIPSRNAFSDIFNRHDPDEADHVFACLSRGRAKRPAAEFPDNINRH